MTLARFFRRSAHRPDRWDDDPTDAAFVELLAACASETVPADDPALSRSREALRSAFVQARQPAARVETGRRAARHFAPRRLGFAATLVAIMVLSSVAGVLAESGAGQPFYRLRLDVEALTLPAPGTPERLAADLDRAQSRLDEAARAATGSDWAAEAAATDAYADVIAAITGEPGATGDPVRTKLGAQLQTLERLRASDGAPANASLESAIRRVSALLAGSSSPDSTSRPEGDHGNGGTSVGPAATGGSDGSGGPQSSSGPKSSAGPQTSVGPRTSAGPNGSARPSGTGGGGPGGNDAAGSSPSPSGQGVGPNGGDTQGPGSPVGPGGNGTGAAGYSGSGSGSGQAAPSGGA